MCKLCDFIVGGVCVFNVYSWVSDSVLPVLNFIGRLNSNETIS